MIVRYTNILDYISIMTGRAKFFITFDFSFGPFKRFRTRVIFSHFFFIVCIESYLKFGLLASSHNCFISVGVHVIATWHTYRVCHGLWPSWSKILILLILACLIDKFNSSHAEI